MSDHENARRYLAMADRDLRAVHGMLDSSVFAEEVFGFHAQQAAEKALKAWLCMAGVPFRKVHDLEALLNLLTDAKEDNVSQFVNLIHLTEFAVDLRYASPDLPLMVLDRSGVAREVKALLEFVRARVQQEG